jgi:membrane protease subunit HflK
LPAKIDKKNPWGGNGQTPPELDEVIKDFNIKFSGIFAGKPRPDSEKSTSPPIAWMKFIIQISLEANDLHACRY